jgi:trimeric autotransporter adhesin
MPSTYTLNNGIELIATGEQSGTWGDTTNLNLGLVDTALDGQVTVTLPAAGSSGSPNALAISDGSASDGRNRLIIFTDGGDLGATAFVQLTPNDAEKIVYIRNNLTGGRAITLFQGTYNASNDYEVPAGTTAVVFFNGGGAGAVAANVFNNAFFDSLRLGGVSVTAILDEDNMASDSATALATQQSIKAYVDAQVGANNELSEVLANGNTSGGNNIQMTTTDEVQFRDTALKISSSVDGQLDIDADVELEITAPTVDINASTAVTIDTTTLTMTGSVNVVGDLDVDNLNLNGNAIISTNTNGNIALTPNGVGEVDISKVDIDGGTIDGTTIGGSSAAAGTFTNLEANGTIKLDGNYPVGTANVALGDAALDDGSLTGASNTAVGACALTANTSGASNTATGQNVLSANTTGSSNTAMGVNALCANVEGDQSVAVGVDALRNQNPVGNADMNNVAVGYQAALCTTTGVGNTAVGASSLRLNTTGANNTANGLNALLANTTGSNNVAIGFCALQGNTTASDNVAIGFCTLQANTTGIHNVAIGRDALQLNVEGDQSVAVGREALKNQNPVGNVDMNNVAVGYQAALCTTTGVGNTAVGMAALRLNTTGCLNTAVGCSAFCTNTTGSFSVAVGRNALLSNTTGGSNTAVGMSALVSNTTGNTNTVVGNAAAACNTTGNLNVAVGVCALWANTTGCLNTALGNSALLSNVEGDNSTAVGHDALRNQNPVGNADMNNVAVGYQAACATTTGIQNTAIGACSLRVNTTGTLNVAMGAQALFSNVEGDQSVAIGNDALRNQNPVGNADMNNVAVGFQALRSLTTGVNNIGVGTQAGRTGATPAGIVNITTESNRIVMGNDDHTCAQIKIAWTATSDCRDKTCFKPIAHGLDFVRALKPTEYQFKQGGRDSAETDGKRRYGFLAQDILPLEGDEPVIISADNPEKLQYTESHLIPILVKAIQELTARVEELENNA